LAKLKIGVIGGTPIDTKMGVDFIKKNGFEALGLPAASNPEEQNYLQYMNPQVLNEKIISFIQKFNKDDINKVMIYCNSLSSAIDLNNIKKIFPGTLIITPHDVYRKLAKEFKSLMIWAANGQSLHNIEKIFYEHNPNIKLIGISLLPVIISIEKGIIAENIFEEYKLQNFVNQIDYIEGILFGCTHLPYLKDLLVKSCNLPIIDPADEMLNLLISSRR